MARISSVSLADCAGDVYRRFSRDELLTNVTLYWMTETVHSSFRLYLRKQKGAASFRVGRFCSCTVRHRPLSEGDLGASAGLGGAGLQRSALVGNAAWGPFRRIRRTGTPGSGPSIILSRRSEVNARTEFVVIGSLSAAHNGDALVWI
jgi:hypothetical protein